MLTPENAETAKPAPKRVFTTYWSETAVIVVDRLTYSQQEFFEHTNDQSKNPVRQMAHPDSMPFRELRQFLGKKTRVTIEVIE